MGNLSANESMIKPIKRNRGWGVDRIQLAEYRV
jgi:hypothetical protein